MRIRSIELEGFMSYGTRQRLDLTGVTMAAVVGPNHTGKSALISKSIEWCLWGKTQVDTQEQVITYGADRATVTVEFELSGGVYQVWRTLSRKSGAEASLSTQDPSAPSGWRPLTEKNVTHTVAEVVALLGIDHKTALMTFLARQGEYGRLASAAPAERRQILLSAFGHSYAELAKVSEDRHRASEKELTGAEAAVVEIETSLAEDIPEGALGCLDDADVDELVQSSVLARDEAQGALAALDDNTAAREHRAAVAALASKREARVELVTAAQAEVERAQGRAQRETAAIKAAEAELEQVASAHWVLPELETRRAELQTSLDEAWASNKAELDTAASADTVAAELGTTLTRLTTEGAEAKERSEALARTVEHSKGTCFACSQPLSTDAARALIQQQDQIRDKARAEYRDTQREIRETQARKTAAETAAAAAAATAARVEQELRGVEAERHRLEERLQGEQAARERVSAARSRGVDAHNEHDRAVAHLRDVEKPDKREQDLAAAVDVAAVALEKATADVAGQRAKLVERRQTAQTQLRDAEREQARRAEISRRTDSLNERLGVATRHRDTLAGQVRVYKLLREAFGNGPKGIPAMILAGSIKSLNADANVELTRLTKGRLSLDIRPRRRGKTDEIAIDVVGPKGVESYHSLSGAQQFHVNLALRIGLLRTISRRTDTPIETFILDEGWGALDPDYVSTTVETITALSKDFAVFTVSHVPEVRDSFPVTIDVSAATGTSVPEVRVGR